MFCLFNFREPHIQIVLEIKHILRYANGEPRRYVPADTDDPERCERAERAAR